MTTPTVTAVSDTLKQSTPPLQEASIDIWDKKYRLRDKDGIPVEDSIPETYARVAKALADVELTEEKRKYWEPKFLWALEHGGIPAGRIISNAGATKYKPATSTINCTVSDTIPDSMEGILNQVYRAGLTLRAGCGIGYEFSTLRPKNAFVAGAGANTSGPLSFMEIFDKMCFTISSAGGRRGAEMGTFDVGHPDVLEFIKAKRQDGVLRQFNLSLLITKDFIEAVKNKTDWKLSFPVKESDAIDVDDPEKVIWRDIPPQEGNVVKDGRVACKIFNTIPAQQLWDTIMQSTYDYAEPGFILIDEVNSQNNNWFCESIRATNPCGPA